MARTQTTDTAYNTILALLPQLSADERATLSLEIVKVRTESGDTRFKYGEVIKFLQRGSDSPHYGVVIGGGSSAPVWEVGTPTHDRYWKVDWNLITHMPDRPRVDVAKSGRFRFPTEAGAKQAEKHVPAMGDRLTALIGKVSGVQVKYVDGKWYPGTITKIKGDVVTIHWPNDDYSEKYSITDVRPA